MSPGGMRTRIWTVSIPLEDYRQFQQGQPDRPIAPSHFVIPALAACGPGESFALVGIRLPVPFTRRVRWRTPTGREG